MKLWCEQNWRDYLPEFTCGWRDHEYAVGFSIGNRYCDPLVLVDLAFMPLWRNVGEATQAALNDQKFRDYQEFGITWQMLLRDWWTRAERKFHTDLSRALGFGRTD